MTRIYLRDKVRGLGCGFRYVKVLRRGYKWVTLEDTGGRKFRVRTEMVDFLDEGG